MKGLLDGALVITISLTTSTQLQGTPQEAVDRNQLFKRKSLKQLNFLPLVQMSEKE